MAAVSGGGFRGGFFGCLGVGAAILLIVAVLGAIGQCSKTMVAARDGAPASASSTLPSGTRTYVPGSGPSPWTYSQEADPLTDKPTRFACVTSLDDVHLTFPYHNTDARLCIRHGARKGTAVYVELNGSGQILCGIEECAVNVRFDGHAPQAIPAVGAADNSTNIIFLRREATTISRIKSSKRMVVEFEMFQAGTQALTFNTAKLVWPPK